MGSKINRLLINICCGDLDQSRRFYQELFELNVNFESDWFVHLVANEVNFEIGLIDETNSIVPDGAKHGRGGSYLTFVIEDVDVCFEKMIALGSKVIQKPIDMDYGQRRMLIEDPSGYILDISSLIKEVI